MQLRVTYRISKGGVINVCSGNETFNLLIWGPLTVGIKKLLYWRFLCKIIVADPSYPRHQEFELLPPGRRCGLPDADSHGISLLCLYGMWRGGETWCIYLGAGCWNKGHKFIHVTDEEPIREESDGRLDLLGPQEVLDHLGHVAAVRRPL